MQENRQKKSGERGATLTKWALRGRADPGVPESYLLVLVALFSRLHMLLMSTAVRMLSALLTGLGGALRIVLEVTAAVLSALALTGVARAVTFPSHNFELLFEGGRWAAEDKTHS